MKRVFVTVAIIAALSAVLPIAFIGCGKGKTSTSTTPPPTAEEAQNMIDTANAYIARRDFGAAKPYLDKLREKTTYDTLSDPQKAQVDQIGKLLAGARVPGA